MLLTGGVRLAGIRPIKAQSQRNVNAGQLILKWLLSGNLVGIRSHTLGDSTRICISSIGESTENGLSVRETSLKRCRVSEPVSFCTENDLSDLAEWMKHMVPGGNMEQSSPVKHGYPVAR